MVFGGVLMFRQLACSNLNLQATLLKRLCPIQNAGICSKAIRDRNYKKPAPFPYKEKKYTGLTTILDRTTSRFDENSKIIVVDGPIAAGKSEFAKKLAQELDMLYVPEGNMDLWYLNSYGQDFRDFDSRLPEGVQSFDTNKFLNNPNHKHVARYQIQMYNVRFMQYVGALVHLLNTGEGVVLDRSCYSDFVFLEAMAAHNYVSPGAKSIYYDIIENTLHSLMRPHLVIYLDVPVPTVLERIQKRNIPGEKKVLTKKYLEIMEQNYKMKFLKDISTHAELLMYDWSNYGDAEVVVEDVERLDFDKYEDHDAKMEDWRLPKEPDWSYQRYHYMHEQHILQAHFNVPRYDVPELIVPAEHMKAFWDILSSEDGWKYIDGYNASKGDKVLFKMFSNFSSSLAKLQRN